jgi:HEAT repeat protein
VGLARAEEVQEIAIGIIDFYGLGRVPADRVREALTFKEGDVLSMAGEERPAVLKASEERLATVPDVDQAKISIVCCDQGRAIVYVGIQERGAPAMPLRSAPKGTARLPADILQAGEEFWKAFRSAVQRGDAAEDRSKGHSLAHDPATRAVQERFVGFADRDLSVLRQVLRGSSDADQRSLAAQVLGYVSDKEAVVEDLVRGMSDPSDEVRNSAMRALVVFSEMVPEAGRKAPRVPADPFIGFLHSSIWSDRNKASLALMDLSAGRDPRLLAKLRRDALAPLAEMARWKNEGHAVAAFTILGRIAGYSDEAARELRSRGEGEAVIDAAIHGPRP